MISFSPAGTAKLYSPLSPYKATARVQDSSSQETKVCLLPLRVLQVSLGRGHHLGHHLRRHHRPLQRSFLRSREGVRG